MRLKFFTSLCAVAGVMATVSMRADLAGLLTPSTQTGTGNNESFFTGNLTNTSPTDNLFLNNIQINFTDAATNYFSADTNVFFANVPGILLPGETYSDVAFGIVIAPMTPPGEYFGTVSIEGGADIFAATNLASPTFEISLPPAMLCLAVSATNLVLSWPSPPGGFVLQENSDLTTTNWLAVTNLPSVTNGQNQVIIAPASGSQFYRLSYQ